MPELGGDLNGSTQHFILNGKDGVSGDGSRISSRFHCGGENGAVGSLARRGVGAAERTRMISKKPVPDLIRDGNRFSDQIMRKEKA
jgi:hypothetical protein